jgi:hypothetical protein
VDGKQGKEIKPARMWVFLSIADQLVSRNIVLTVNARVMKEKIHWKQVLASIIDPAVRPKFASPNRLLLAGEAAPNGIV